MRLYLLLILLPLTFTTLKAQNTQLLEAYKDSIKHYSSEITLKKYSDEQKQIISDSIASYIVKLAKQEKSIDYDLSDLKIVRVLTSNDKHLRIFTWLIPLSNKTYKYKGIAQTYSTSKKVYRVHSFNDKGSKIGYLQSKTLNIKKWYGAYYYSIIETKRGKKKFYSLIGWRGISKTIQSKVIEVITLNSKADITFGYNIFNIKGYSYFGKGNQSSRRLIFKYSSQSKMYLDYDFQTIVLTSKKKSKSKPKTNYKPGFNAQDGAKKAKVKVKTIKDNMIVLDRLIPTSPQMLEFYDFYFPESNIMDALRWENNKWKYYPDIDARNEKDGNNQPRKIEYDL